MKLRRLLQGPWVDALDRLKGRRWVHDESSRTLTCEALTSEGYFISIHCREVFSRVTYRWWPWPRVLLTHHLYSVVGAGAPPEVRFAFDRIRTQSCPVPHWTSPDYRQRASIGMYIDWLHREYRAV